MLFVEIGKRGRCSLSSTLADRVGDTVHSELVDWKFFLSDSKIQYRLPHVVFTDSSTILNKALFNHWLGFFLTQVVCSNYDSPGNKVGKKCLRMAHLFIVRH